MPRSSFSFVGFLYCPVCKVETRHYALTHNFESYRSIFCDICRVVRLQKKGEELKSGS